MGVAFHVGNRAGSRRQKIRLTFAETSAPDVDLIVAAFVQPEIELDRSVVRLASTTVAAEVPQRVRANIFIRDVTMSPVVESNADWLSAKVVPGPVGPGNEMSPPVAAWDLDLIQTRPLARPGMYHAAVHVKFGMLSQHMTTIWVTNRVDNWAQALPRLLHFGTVTPGQVSNRKVRLRLGSALTRANVSQLAFQHSLDDELEASLMWIDDRTAEVDATLRPRAPQRIIDTHLNVVLSGAADAELQIPVQAYVASGAEQFDLGSH
jgi:hypothetical protein